MIANAGEAEASEAVGPRILRMRRARGLTQQRLAEPRYTHAYVSSVEAGRRRPSPEAMRYFADKLDVSFDELAYGRPPGLAVELQQALTEARRMLSAGEVSAAHSRYVEVEQTATRYDVPLVRAAARAGLAEVALHQGHAREATALFSAAEQIVANWPLSVRVWYVTRRTYCLFRLGNLNEAVSLLEATLETNSVAGTEEPETVMLLHGALIPPYVEMGSLQRAARAASIALELAPRCENREGVARVHLAAARALFERGEVAEGESAIGTAATLFRELGLDSELARCLWSSGYLLLRTERAGEAVEKLETARTVALRTGERDIQAGATVELAEACYRLGRLDEAESQAGNAAAAAAEFSALPVRAQACRLQGVLARDRGDASRAELSLREAMHLYERAEVYLEASQTSRALGDLLLAAGRTEDALNTYRHGLVIAEQAR